MALLETELCKDVGISPAGFFNLQTRKEYYEYQYGFAKDVFALRQKCKRKSGGYWAWTGPKGIITEEIPSLVQTRTAALSEWKQRLDEDNQNSLMPAAALESEADWRSPRTVVCIDKARALLERPGSPLFWSLSRGGTVIRVRTYRGE